MCNRPEQDEGNEFKVPKETAGDHLHTLVRAGISAIPVVGGPGVELFQMVIAPPIRRRQNEWMDSVAERLHGLEAKQQCIVDELQNNNAFIDTAMQALQAANRTANQEKRDALRNAVLNAALPSPPDEARQQVFVTLVDQFSVWHLRILCLFSDPPKWFRDRGKQPPQISGNLSQLLELAYPELMGQRDFYDVIGKDLFQRGLFRTNDLHAMMSGGGVMAKRSTTLGDEFLAFITEPATDKA
jgi:hypothetical protein